MVLFTLGWFTVECEAVVMRISTFNSQPMVLKHKRVECPLLVRDKLLSQAEHN